VTRSRLEGRIKRLEALQGEEVDTILDDLNYEQGQAILTYLMALLRGAEEPSDEHLRGSGLSRDRYAEALASIPLKLQERFIAAFVARTMEKAK
jgi:hypothetical protein